MTEEMNEKLCSVPSNEEIRKATFAIHADKAPGPDGFSAGFYHSFWNIIGSDVCREIRLFFESGVMNQRTNETHVCLLPKGNAPKLPSDYRPIALCNVRYKIVAKVLTGRLQPLLDQLISNHQSAFVPGRAISDNVIITHETHHFLKTSKATKRCSMIVKTDMSKAYDRIEWGFLRAVLERLGFHTMWIKWIMACVTTVSYTFLINGSPNGKAVPTRGLRQGDPLSPYLFILCTEVLSGLCKRAQLSGRLKGLQVARKSPFINHLLFADDTMFFCRTNEVCCKELNTILQIYKDSSGQCINLNKSTITFSGSTPALIKERVKRGLGIDKEGGMGKYLGLPEHFGRKKRDIFTGLVDKIRQRSHSWTTRYLSGAGKQVLLQSVLSALPSYTMSCFKIPKSLCKRIQSILTRFWWDDSPDKRKMSWIAWNKLTLSKGVGGLGFKDIEDFNDALLAKVSWRLIAYPDSLLSQVLLGKYCHNTSFLDCPVALACSHGWRGIMAGREVLKTGLGWLVGNGEKIKIWQDPWLSTSQPVIPVGPPTEINQDLTVNHLLIPNSNEWNIPAIRHHLPLYEETIRQLYPSSLKPADSLVWLPEKSGKYSTRSGYRAIQQTAFPLQITSFNWYNNIWNLNTSPKLKHFLWRAARGALPVGENLATRGIMEVTNCKRCGAAESTLHILLSCPFAENVWNRAPLWKGPNLLTNLVDVKALLAFSRKSTSLPPMGLNTTRLYPWILWNLWTARNRKKVFRK